MKDKKKLNVGSNLGANSNEHWQMNVKLTRSGGESPMDAFNPKKPSSRPCLHIKTNEMDY